MSEYKHIFYVDRANHNWSSDRFDSLEKAQEYARSAAWNNGQEQYIFKAIGVARRPELIKEISIETVK